MVKKDFGKFYTPSDIDYMLDYDEEKHEHHRRRSSRRHSSQNTTALVVRTKSNQMVTTSGRRPVYPKIHIDDIEIETLQFWDLPWEYEPGNEEYIVILKELSIKETDKLFEHTKRLRKRRILTIEDRGTKSNPQYALVRRRSKSRDRRPSSFLGVFK